MDELSEMLQLGQDINLRSIRELLLDLDEMWKNHRLEEYISIINEFEEKMVGFQIRRSTSMGDKHGLFIKDEIAPKI